MVNGASVNRLYSQLEKIMSKLQLDKASSLIIQGEKSQAVDIVKEVLKQDRNNIDAWWLMANALDEDEDRKIISLERVLALDPSHQKAQKMIGELRPDRRPSIAEVMESSFPEQQPLFMPKSKNDFEPASSKTQYLIYGLSGVAVLAILFLGFAVLSRFGILDGELSVFTVGDSQTVNIPANDFTDLEFYADGIVTITVERQGSFDPTVQVLNSQGQELAYNDDHDTRLAGLDTLDSAVQYLRVSGQGTIRVSGFADEGGRATVSIVAVDIEEISLGDIAVGESRTINIPYGGIVELSLRTEQTVTITVQGDTFVDPVLEVISYDGRLLAANDDHNTSFNNLSTLDSAVEGVQVNGQAYIRVLEFLGEGGSVTVTVR
jgi:antitoxin component of MazEF toxin-antitoxin module